MEGVVVNEGKRWWWEKRRNEGVGTLGVLLLHLLYL